MRSHSPSLPTPSWGSEGGLVVPSCPGRTSTPRPKHLAKVRTIKTLPGLLGQVLYVQSRGLPPGVDLGDRTPTRSSVPSVRLSSSLRPLFGVHESTMSDPGPPRQSVPVLTGVSVPPPTGVSVPLPKVYRLFLHSRTGGPDHSGCA